MAELVTLRHDSVKTTIETVLAHLELALALLDEASPHSAVAARLQEVIDLINDELPIPFERARPPLRSPK